MRARLLDVADLAGVSKSTASLVLNDRADAIPAATRKRVTDAAAQLGYRPNVVAQNLRNQRSRTIAMLSDQVVTTPYAGAMVEGAQDVASEGHYGLLLANIDGSAAAETGRAIQAVLDRQVDAAIYATMDHRVVQPPDELANIPTVYLNCRPANDKGSWVVPDEVGGATAAVEHLIANGHSRIGWIDETDASIASRQRSAVWAEVLERHGLEARPQWIGRGESTSAGGTAAAQQVLGSADRPTALFCFNDRMASGVAITARRLGLSVPEDLSLVGYDNQVLVAEAIDPGLTTVQLPHLEMGRWAMEHVLGLLDEGKGAQGKVMPCPLVERQSVAPPGLDNA